MREKQGSSVLPYGHGISKKTALLGGVLFIAGYGPTSNAGRLPATTPTPAGVVHYSDTLDYGHFYSVHKIIQQVTN